MTGDNGDEPEEEAPIVPGGPLDCQDCGEHMGRQMAAGFMKREGSKTYVAGICPECMVRRLGLEWREMKDSHIVVAGAGGRLT